ncbi:MAG: hypothetical protein ACE5I1_29135 [bacterium]
MKELKYEEMVQCEGGISLACIGVLAGAAAWIFGGPVTWTAAAFGAAAGGLAIACGCDDELDSAFGTNFVGLCS